GRSRTPGPASAPPARTDWKPVLRSQSNPRDPPRPPWTMPQDPPARPLHAQAAPSAVPDAAPESSGGTPMFGLTRLSSLLLLGTVLIVGPARGDEPPAIDPFGPRSHGREDALPGHLELSDGTVRPGKLYLTRDARLRIFDNEQQRFREVPL